MESEHLDEESVQLETIKAIADWLEVESRMSEPEEVQDAILRCAEFLRDYGDTLL